MVVAEPTDGGSFLYRVSSRLPYLAPSLRQVGEYILRHPEDAQAMTITVLAAQVGVAESTVSRFAREIGVSNYQSLRLAVAEATFASRADSTRAEQRFVYEGINRGDTSGVIVGKIERSSREALRRTAMRLNIDAVEKAVDLIESANVLVFCCMGSSSIAAEDGVTRFTRAGKKCVLFRDQSLQVMLASILGPGDLLIGISDSGQSTAIVNALRQGRSRGIPTIGLTSTAGSPLFDSSDVTLFTGNVPADSGLYGESVTSKWGQLLVVDILYATFAARHYDETVTHLEDTYAAGIKHSRTT